MATTLRMVLRGLCMCGEVKAVQNGWEGATKEWKGKTFCGNCGETVSIKCQPNPEERRATDILHKLAPSMDGTRHKGQNGRIGIIGGSEIYTGAPYFSAMAALRVGAELAYVLTAREATLPIKSYSPELMVTPLYRTDDIHSEVEQQNIVEVITNLAPRFHSAVLGPGLGTNPHLASPLAKGLRVLGSTPLVIDADGLRILSKAPRMICGLHNVVLTPNAREIYLFFPEGETRDTRTLAEELARRFNVTVVLKGKHDVITNGTETMLCTLPGCPRRVGGLGDFLSGTIGVLLGWRAAESVTDVTVPEACHAACSLVRKAAELAFEAKHRSMSTVDVMDMIGTASHQLFPARL
eukprot:TRINITY_DN2559_c2_g1_i2.p1 TRINITY_DN2559_c2_g1~~TRINITY_DN2559_c2_g1_i2.p1  ORF type:complete len:352 (+),score=45.59 TRINITY_DN2559_c2_g1_i2:212-1267(+)